ncbi:MAG: tail fiber domain-containing protein [Acidobacteriota bacterium]|nr:tail fiber domain-containing protein [Acidobacteriota bacterium]
MHRTCPLTPTRRPLVCIAVAALILALPLISSAQNLSLTTEDANSAPALEIVTTDTLGVQNFLTVEATGDLNLRSTVTGNTNGTSWEWRQVYRANQFNLELDGGDQLTLYSNGDANFQGDVTANGVFLTSDRSMKEDFQPVNPADILTKIGEMPVTSWSYKRDQGAVRHIGPVAQDFHAAFGVGTDDKHIATTDAHGVAFAAIQALYQQLQETRAELEQLRQQLEESNTPEP